MFTWEFIRMIFLREAFLRTGQWSKSIPQCLPTGTYEHPNLLMLDSLIQHGSWLHMISFHPPVNFNLSPNGHNTKYNYMQHRAVLLYCLGDIIKEENWHMLSPRGVFQMILANYMLIYLIFAFVLRHQSKIEWPVRWRQLPYGFCHIKMNCDNSSDALGWDRNTTQM